MRAFRLFSVAIVCSLVFFSCSQRPLHLFLAGDSTMSDKPLTKSLVDSVSGDTITEPYPERGWGMVLKDYFKKELVIVNVAKNGRSSKSFRAEKLWASIMNTMQKGDYVVIQFGHNDEQKPGKKHSTSPQEFKANIEQYVDDVVSKGGIPILCTPITRRSFDSTGVFVESHGVYPDCIRDVAKEKHVILIDMHKSSTAMLLSLGVEGSESYWITIPPGVSKIYPEGKIDNTHLREKGARAMAELFIQGLKDQKIDTLTHYLK